MLSGDHIFQLGDDGVLRAINKLTGHTFWQRSLGTAVGLLACRRRQGRVRERALARRRRRRARFALNYATGSTIWSRDLPSPSESSPLVDHGMVFFGSQNGTVYALNAGNGSVVWTYHAGGAVKASPTLSGGALYFGDYSGHVQAVSERTGRRLWISGSEGALLGSGTFYSTPAAFYGRIFLGNTDGRVYAYDAATRQARLGRADGRLRVRLAGGHQRSRPRPDDLPGLLRRHLLCAQRPLGPDRLDVRRARQDLRLGDDHRTHRVLRRPRHAPHLRARHLHRPGDVRAAHGLVRSRDQRRQGPVHHGLEACTRSRRADATPRTPGPLDAPRRRRAR